MKTCTKCKETKTLAEFYKRQNGLASWCKDCTREQQRQNWRGWPSVIHRTAVLKRKFGITPEDYANLLALQGGVCKLCGRPEKNRALAVDHNHTTKVVRGLLCTNCNTMLGRFNDSPERFREVAAYLEAA